VENNDTALPNTSNFNKVPAFDYIQFVDRRFY